MSKTQRTMGKSILVLIGASVLFSAQAAMAGELVYQPVNPAFGGNPLNEDFLIGTAQIQNQFIPQQGGGGGGTPNIDFPDIDIDLGGIGGGAPPIIIAPTTPVTN